uniref:Uncharacterized protein n=1 Tax=Anopheles atroparvus TaxID=41427 RepID=A0A182JIJ5_ANOAO
MTHDELSPVCVESFQSAGAGHTSSKPTAHALLLLLLLLLLLVLLLLLLLMMILCRTRAVIEPQSGKDAVRGSVPCHGVVNWENADDFHRGSNIHLRVRRVETFGLDPVEAGYLRLTEGPSKTVRRWHRITMGWVKAKGMDEASPRPTCNRVNSYNGPQPNSVIDEPESASHTTLQLQLCIIEWGNRAGYASRSFCLS